MSREFARAFYDSGAWQRCREGYRHFRGGLCERCLKKGLINPGVIVHHKVHLTPENINDTRITLSYENLELLCRDCHAAEHGHEKKRYRVGPYGEIFLEDCPTVEIRGEDKLTGEGSVESQIALSAKNSTKSG